MRAAEAGELAMQRVSAERAAVEELRDSCRASNERRAAEAAAAAADRAAVTRREQQLEAALETERALHEQARTLEVAEMQGLLQQLHCDIEGLEGALMKAQLLWKQK